MAVPPDPDPAMPASPLDRPAPGPGAPASEQSAVAPTLTEPIAEDLGVPAVPCPLCATPIRSGFARCRACNYPRTTRLSGRQRWVLAAGFAAVWLATFLGALALR